MRILLLIVVLLGNSSVFASFQMNEDMQMAYLHIINLEFDAAQNLLNKEKIKRSNNGIIYLNENYIDFLKIIIGEEFTYFEKQEKLKNERLKKIISNDKSSPYYLYSQAEIHLQWAFARIKFKEYLTAAYEIQKAYSLIKKNHHDFPDFKLNLKSLGLLHILVGSIQKEYKWVMKLVGIEGNINMGLNELNELLTITKNDEHLSVYNTETLFLLSFLQLNYANDKRDYRKLLEKIAEDYSLNYLLNFAAARLSAKLGMNDFTIKILESRPNSKGKYPFYYLDYLLGMSKLYQLDSSAAKHFNYFLSNFKGKNYIKSAYQKLAWIAYLNTDLDKYQYFCQMTLTNGQALFDEDKQAEKQVKIGMKLQQFLLKSRLLYDGGYYSRALAQLESIETIKTFLNLNTQLEYWYRKGRIYQALDKKFELVFDCFEKSYGMRAHTSTYFAPMSVLQIGIEYEKIGNFDKAKLFYNKCLAISNFDYQRGIHQKARAGLNRIKNYN